ncbi:L-aminoadipate-semialdehyde dehydrogenase [Mycena sanguinolenta]|uniref:L-aminoadipate-semialdehyde dehydrogenase n=1 Tax=Mycena sanguinolenta TaxID=230812 RepID=A0A8H6Z0C6_9AGAR|nr:L-aminoadipate-semialdehyde dehydrogenase [Mycena sanguinolenta]
MSEPLVLRLPVELFMKIFTFIPRTYLFDLSTVCHTFHDLAAPLIFATFRFHPGVYGETSASGTCLRRELDRLSFWSSDAIAPLVRKCFIWLYCTSITTDSIESSTLGTAAFEAVSRFKHLRTLSCNFGNHKVEFTGLRVEGLADLQSIKINAGILAPPHDPGEPRLEIRHFAYTEIPFLPLSRPPCISLLDPTRLHSLELSYFHPHGLEHFLGDASTIAPFHNLRTLHISFRDTDLTHIHAAISPFPSVCELTVHIHGSCSAEVVPTTPLAPHLESYKGPAVLLPLVMADSAPDKLVITKGSTTQVLEALRAAMHPEFVTSLSMGVKLNTDIRQGDVLQDIFRLCPNLSRTSLEVSSDDLPVVTDGGFNTITLSQKLVEIFLPLKELETLVLQWRLGSVIGIVPRKSELEILLRSRLPALQYVFFVDTFGLLRY